MANIRLIAAIAVFYYTPATAQVPPPPPSPGQSELMNNLIQSIEGKDATSYSALLDENVQVYKDGALVAKNRKGWMSIYGRMLKARGVFLNIKSAYYSTGHFMFIEHYNTIASFGGESPADCCTGFDASSYDVVNGKIKVVRRITGGQEAKIPK